jgi:two-component system sensor histidine kinase CpxA
MKTRVSISVKILVLSFLNVILLGLVFAIFIRVQYRFDLGSLLPSPGRDRILAMSRDIALQLPDTDRARWNQLLAQHSSTTHATAYLFSNDGTQLAGPAVSFPRDMLEMVRQDQGPPFGFDEGRDHRPGPPGGMPPPPPRPPVFLIKAGTPPQYWVGVRVPIRDKFVETATLSTLVWAFPSLWTNPFFFDYKPWLAVVLAVVFISAVCWLPLIRGLTRSISQLTAATGAIAEGRLETRLSIKRRDELGQLSEAINRMAERLSGFVRGQRRFLSDIAHELCSPIARIQVSLGILDQRAEDNQKKYVQGVQEEVEHMSELINELLLFSKAEMNASTTPLTRVNVAETVVHVLQREALKEAQIESHIDGKLEVMARPDYLFRSLANVLRNAIRYAGDAGPIVVSANSGGDLVSIRVTDSGPGLPPAELEEVFKPFYRPELARQRETGGVGLGLAIVRSCVGACGGVVQCRNRSPKGFEVEIRLPVAKS